jgi:hypothetical protein
MEVSEAEDQSGSQEGKWDLAFRILDDKSGLKEAFVCQYVTSGWAYTVAISNR